MASANVIPAPSRRPRAAVRVDRAGQQPAAQAGHAEPAALLLGERGHHDRPGRAGSPRRATRRWRRTPTPRRAARRMRRRRAPSPGGSRSPPRAAPASAARETSHQARTGCRCRRPPRGAAAVLGSGGLEPGPAFQLSRSPAEPPVAAGGRVAADGQQRVPERRERRHASGQAACRHGCMGTRTPRWAATSAASS